MGLDRYEMKEFLGAGGMGQVYRAHDTRLNRDVALKVLRGSSDVVAARALREARAQAQVAHPNVCQIFEVGEDDGKAFIAMQLVRGRPLHDVAPDLDLRQKVLVVRQVAEAVQAAHNRGLVHRDLKPSNILVEECEAGDGDGETATGSLRPPRPYVVDFGLAVGPDTPKLTATGLLPGTPAYLPPELLHGGTRGDRKGDIYGLGAILYEALSGQPPYAGTSSVHVLSQVLSASPPSLSKLIPDLPRDLRLIVGKCMDRDPSRRYGSARLLAEDLDRFLDGEPVLARPPTLGYRFGLWLARHRALAAVVSAFVLLSIVGGIRYTFDLRAERQEAEQARRQAEDLSAFLVGIFESALPGNTQGGEPTVRQVLDQASRRLSMKLTAHPSTHARFSIVLAEIYTALGAYDEAESHLDRAASKVEAAGAQRTELFTDMLQAKANLRRWQGQVEDAIEIWERNLELRRSLGLDPAPALIGLGGTLLERSEFGRARDLLEEAVRRLDPDDELAVSGFLELARLEREAGALDRSAELYRKILQHVRAEDDPARRANALNNLGMLQHDRGDLTSAIASFEESVDLRRRILGDSHPRLASSLSNLGRSARHLGDYRRAEAAYGEVLQIYHQTLEPDHYWVGIMLNNLGRLHRDLGAFDQAAEELDRSLEIMRAAVGDRQPRTHYSVINRALVDLDRGRWEAARTGLSAAEEALRDLLGNRHPVVATILEQRARIARRNEPAAESLLREALEIREASHDAGDPRTERCRVRLAHVLVDAGREEEARVLAAVVIETLTQAAGEVVPAAHTVALADARRVQARTADDAAASASAAEAGLALLDRWPRDASALDWLALRADLLDLAGRGDEADALRGDLRDRGYVLPSAGQVRVMPTSRL